MKEHGRQQFLLLICRIYFSKMDTPAPCEPACSSPTRCQHCHCAKLASKLALMWTFGQLTDFTLCVNSVHDIRCHKVILAASSTYFSAYFESNKEQKVSHAFPFCDALGHEIVEQIIEYFYTGRININEGNVRAFLDASEHLELDELKNECLKFMTSQLGSKNCVGLLRFARSLHLEGLQIAARDYILHNFEEVIAISEEIAELSEEELVLLISDDLLNVRCEDSVYCFVKQWMGSGSVVRNEAFERIAKHIRFPFCSRDLLGQLMFGESLMTSQTCETFLKRAVHFAFFPEQQPFFAYPECTARVSYASLFHQPALMCIKHDSPNVQLMTFDDQQWITRWVGEFPVDVRCHALNSSIVVIGKIVGQWKIAQQEFYSLPPLPMEKTYCSCIVHAKKLMVFAEADNSVLSIGLTNDDSKKWTPLPPMPKTPHIPLAVSFGQSIYVFESSESEENSRVTQVYNHWDKRWKLGSRMPCQCLGGAAVVYNEKVYVFGGGSQTAMTYDPLKDSWRVLASPISEHVPCSAVIWKRKILLNGSDSVEEYDPEKDCWVHKPDLSFRGMDAIFRSTPEAN